MKRRTTLVIFVVIVLCAFLVSPVLAAPLTQAAPIELTPSIIAGVIGVIVSLAASYIPKFRLWWADLNADTKQAASAGAMILVGIVLYILACTPSLGFPYVACPTGGLWTLFSIILAALTSNQIADRVSPDMADVKVLKASKSTSTMPTDKPAA